MKAAAVIAALVCAAGSLQLTRAGYSVDEEFTVFAVRGIQTHGLPLLPSGLLYDRGVAYSYVSWLAHALTGSELPVFRALSLAAGALTIILTFVLVRRHTNERAALIAAILLATSMPFWATATTARFYAPFLMVFVAALVAYGTVGPIGTIAFFARLSHELGFLLAAVPLLGRSVRSFAAVAVGLLLAQALLFLLHAVDPPSGETMVRRFFLWQVANLFERPPDRQFGIALVLMAVGVLLLPKRQWLWTVSALSVAAMIMAFSIARASNSAPLSPALVMTTLREGSRYPLDMFWYIARTTPLTLLLAIAGLVLRAWGAGRLRQGFGAQGGEWPPVERAAHLLWIGWVLWFGVIESGITTNYLLLPISFMLIAIAIDVDAIVRIGGTVVPSEGGSSAFAQSATAHKKDPPLRTAAIALIVVGIALDQWRGDGGIREKLEAARPTIHVPGIEEIRDSLQPNDRVVCTDELGCMMLVGRIDRWLALDDYVRERFLVRRSPDVVAGVYTGVPAIFRPGDSFGPNADGTLPERTIVIDIFKDYPIGNSRSWLPKAIEEDGLRVTPLLETPQVRVLQVSPPERMARLQP